MLSLGQLYTDDDTNDDDDDTNDDDNDTRQTNHDCIGSLACMPNEPKSRIDSLKHIDIYLSSQHKKLPRIEIFTDKATPIIVDLKHALGHGQLCPN